MTHEIKLGRRVYGVTKDGTIIPTLICRIELLETEDDKSNSILEDVNIFFDGQSYRDKTLPKIRFRVLDHNPNNVHFTFDEAYEEAVGVLAQLKKKDSITVRNQQIYTAKYDKLVADKEGEHKVVDSIVEFVESDTLCIGRIFKRDKKDPVFTQSSFPQHYIEPGTSAWIADTEGWNLVQRIVTKVVFAPKWQRKHLYYCGDSGSLPADRVFRTKKGALNCLERKFGNTLPGTLDRDRVPIFKTN